MDKAQAKSTELVLKDPLGYKVKIDDVIVKSSSTTTSNMTYTEVLEAKAWNLAKSPSGSIMQSMFMFYMSGSAVSIFTIMITMQFIMSPIGAISSVN